MRLTDHNEKGDALWFQVAEKLGRFSINEFGLITGMKCVGSTHLPPVAEPRLIRRYFPTVRGVSRENLELQMSNVNFDNDEDAVKLSLLYTIFCIPLSNANSVKIDPKFFVLVDNLDEFNDFPWDVLSWEATRSAICNTVDNKTSSKRRPLKKSHQVHYSIAGFSHALLVWAYGSIPTVASKFTTNYEQAIPRMLSWITADNVKFDDVMWAFTAVDEDQVIYLYNYDLLGHNITDRVVITVTTTPVYATTRLGHQPDMFCYDAHRRRVEGTMVAKLFSKNPKGVPQLLLKPSIPRPSFGTNSKWQEFKEEIRGQVDSIKKSLRGKAQLRTPVTSRQAINLPTNESDTLKTTSNDIAIGSQNEVLIESDIGAAADIGVQAAMEFLTGDKVIVSHQYIEDESNKEESTPHSKIEQKEDKEDKDDKIIINTRDVVQPEGPAKEDSTSDVAPKKKRARLSRLGQRPTGSRTQVGSPVHEPSKIICALPRGLADEPPVDTLKEFREWINKGVLKRTPPGKRLPRYNTKHDTLDKPHDLGIMTVDKKSWFNELATSPVWLWDEHIDVAFYYLRKKIKQFSNLEQRNVTTVDTFFSTKVGAMWSVYRDSPDTFDWGTCETLLKIMLGLSVQSGSSCMNAHNENVREGVECLSMFIPLLAGQLDLFDFKPRDPPGMHPIPVTIMKDIPQQANGLG
ncbi:hypothetical protein TIFTF001_050180 [Ficus carica]|uniref:DUF1985 domain-containing protein n=1 Tax=Ficus carica TaxID=3494 RepID=A0AA87YS63_FICCA|nr:hypothetical protein TIFTF001_050180 [Ficus carica]